jgi:outer membrane immunogenic protein
MKKLLCASVVLMAASLGGPAFAADMPLKAPPPPVPVFSWTGCYVGLSIGENYGRAEQNAVAGTSAVRPFKGAPTLFTIPAGTSIVDSYDLSGFIGGAQAGCNYQFAGGWVIGVEGDWSVTNKEGQRFEGPLGDAFGFNGNVWQDSTKERWLGTARLRLGYAVWDKWLWYVTGGGAYAKIDTNSNLIGNPFTTTFTQTDWRGGWTVGAGTEYSLGYGWSIKSEFLYVDFGKWTTFTSGLIPNSVFAPREVQVRDYIFRFGMNYKFGWGVGKAPVAY